MKIFYSFLFLGSALSLSAQVNISDYQVQNRSVNYFEALDADSLFYATMFLSNQGVIQKNNIFIHDKNLNLIDSIDANQTNRLNSPLSVLFRFNDNYYGIASSLYASSSVHRIKHFSLIDSMSFGIDTLQRSYPIKIWQIAPNKVRSLIYERDANNQFIKKSKIIDLDSNFNITAYHAFNFDSIQRRSNEIISDVNFINDSTWHIFTERHSGALHHYNPQEQRVDSSQYLWGEIRKCYRLNRNEYLAMGIVSWSPPVLGLPFTGMDALGFYRMKNDGTPVDTSYFLNIDNNARVTLDFSSEDMNVPAAIVYDTNNIYLASESIYTANTPGSKQEGYLFVVKTDSRGNEHWRYSWGGTNKICNVRGLVSTPDSGCIVIGNYTYEYPATPNLAMILIKLGPDGTISNVELDAPENLVEFYPNPVKDKLSYRYLPEARSPYTLEIIDMNGRPVMETSLDNEADFVPVELSSGFYLYHLKDAEGKIQQVGKLVAE